MSAALPKAEAEAARMVHPGPRAPERVVSVPTRLVKIEGLLHAGQVVMAEVARLFAAHGCAGGVVWLGGMACAPMHYVLPALSDDGVHAAWYSQTHSPSGVTRIETATAMVGWRDGAPFLHCHGIWTEADGRRAMGHLLPFDSELAEDIVVKGLGTLDASLIAKPDPETAFTLFSPEPMRLAGVTDALGTSAVDASGSSLTHATNEQGAILARILPGEDVVTAIETLAAQHGIAEARLHGIGSIDHVRFLGGARMDCLATELRLSKASLSAGRAIIAIDVVDVHGSIASGELEPGANPVGVTLELLIEPLSSPLKSLEGQL